MYRYSLSRIHWLGRTGTCEKLDLEPTEEPCGRHPETQDNRISQWWHHITMRHWQTLNTTLVGYLDCEEGYVSKLLVESCNLVLMNPVLVLCGRLRTEVHLVVVLDGKALNTNIHFPWINLYAEILHKPLVSQEVTGHVSVSVVDERPQAQRQQLQIHLLHCWVLVGVIRSNIITVMKSSSSSNLTAQTQDGYRWLSIQSPDC